MYNLSPNLSASLKRHQDLLPEGESVQVRKVRFHITVTEKNILIYCNNTHSERDLGELKLSQGLNLWTS